jgi:hypothetical protein
MKTYLILFASTLGLAAACCAHVDITPSGTSSTGGGSGPSIDAGPDVADGAPDVVDAAVDAPPSLCADIGVSPIYVAYSDGTSLNLGRFFPQTKVFEAIGPIDCGVAGGTFSIAVEASGKQAYVQLTSGELFRVDTSNAHCEPTGFEAAQLGFDSFNLSFVADPAKPKEMLYLVSGEVAPKAIEGTLGTLDGVTFSFDSIGASSKALNGSRLAGRGDGKLFATILASDGTGQLAEINRKTAEVSTPVSLDPVSQFLFPMGVAAWGDSFYYFTISKIKNTWTDVTEFQPATGTATVVATLQGTGKSNYLLVTAAGASVCASQPSQAGAKILGEVDADW